MPRILQLLISLDETGDSFIDALHEKDGGSGFPDKEELIRMWIRSDQWLNAESSGMAESLDTLSETVFAAINNRMVNSFDLGLLVNAGDEQNIEKFLPVYRHLEGFIRVVATHRLYVIYPRRAREMRPFLENFANLLGKTDETSFKPREINMLLAPETNSGEPGKWPAYQTESYLLTNMTPGFRAGLDNMLLTLVSQCCSASYACCVYDEQAWRSFFMLRAQTDLVSRREITLDRELDSQARQSAHERLGLDETYTAAWPSQSISGVTLQPQIDAEHTDNPAARALDNFLMAMRDAAERIFSSESPRLADARKAHRDALSAMIDNDTTSLDSYDHALYMHRGIVAVFNNPSEHLPAIRKLLLSKLPSVINALIEGLRTFHSETNTASLMTGDQEVVIRSCLADVRRALRAANLAEERLIVRESFSTVLESIDAMIDAIEKGSGHAGGGSCLLPEFFDQHIIARLADGAVEKAAAALDSRLFALKQEDDRTRQSLRDLSDNYGFFKRLFRFPEYLRARSSFKDDLANINAQYRQWGETVNVFLRSVMPFLSLCAELRFKAKLAAEHINRVTGAGQFLVDFNTALNARQAELREKTDAIPDGPVQTDCALSFLSKDDMEHLYAEFGPPTIGEYLDWLLRGRDSRIRSWGQWAAEDLNKYIEKMESYIESRYSALIPLNLPILMTRYFPEHVVPRLRSVVQTAANKLLPLAEENLVQRRFLMMFGFPDAASSLLRDMEAEIVYRNQSIALEPACVIYEENENPMRLDLALNVCGFQMNEHILVKREM